MIILLAILGICIFIVQIGLLFDGRKIYFPYVNEGKQIAKKSKLILATSLRDCESHIESLHNFYNYFYKYFERVKLVVMENDSKDNTRKKLFELKKKGVDIDIVGCGLDAPVCDLQTENIRKGCGKKRIRRMSMIRNILLEHIKQIQSSYDFCIIMDGDIKGRIETKGFLESIYYLKNRQDIDAIACYGIQETSPDVIIGQMYDSYAYEPEHGNQWLSQLSSHFMKGLVKVKSAFNGLVIYKLPFLEKLKYFENTIFCEHISFHKDMKIYINRDFIFTIQSH